MRWQTDQACSHGITSGRDNKRLACLRRFVDCESAWRRRGVQTADVLIGDTQGEPNSGFLWTGFNRHDALMWPNCNGGYNFCCRGQTLRTASHTALQPLESDWQHGQQDHQQCH
jgi:hypothetical protein